ncbi:MAG TPA: glycosyl hydrolase family 3 [Cyanobacteria bacterium UBA9226]|nr:glycosyl hydrolase family 3 [Cyanobacteria bacterium UBA9226]
MKILKLCLAIVVLVLAFYFRTPFLASLRPFVFWGIIVLSLALIVREIPLLKDRSLTRQSLLSFLILTIAAFTLSATVAREVKFNEMKNTVLSQNPQKIEYLGQHFIIGYRDFNEIKNLVTKKAICGIFITRRNINNKSPEQIKQEIQSLQKIRTSQGLSPLWIATDQEGGIVSRLSPPLTQLPPLSKFVEGKEKIEKKKEVVVEYAKIHGEELSEIGVNVNFAPVVDLNKGIINPKDKYSQIYQRAISADQNVVAKVGLWYCQTLEIYKVHCTIKHFPGLGRVDADTHLQHADLNTSVKDLTKEDWVPFRQIMSNFGGFTMLGHVKLTGVDRDTPVSFSKKVVMGILRNSWQYDGILITDDFSMEAVYGSRDGLEGATVKAINAGVDLILIAYDTDLYYQAMDALLSAEAGGKLDDEMLLKSQARLGLSLQGIGARG